MNRLILSFAALLATVGQAPRAVAHEVHIACLELRQTAQETYAVLWKTPARDNLIDGARPGFPEGCRVTSPSLRYATPEAVTERFTLLCPSGLHGRLVTLDGPLASLLDVVVRVEQADGTVQTAHLSANEASFRIGSRESGFHAAATYFRLGIEHILTGVDHLLFVLGLLLIVRNRWMLLKTITAFTIAHSITLAIATLGYGSAPLPPLNAAIALSILFLGPEIIRARRGETSFSLRRPWLVAFAFGLLHGFGFASGLIDLGIPSAEVPFALLSFNLGVEAGQLFFVALILLLFRSFRVLGVRWSEHAASAPAYALGTLGAFWTLQRISIMLTR
ncbi:MAG TPA: HupE/UreJ family protein [Terrimicrobiaceae bacterium]